MAADTERLQELVDAVVTGLGLECVEVTYGPEAGRRILRVLIDAPAGVSLDECARVSRALGPVLEAAPEIDGKYYLEVSSPGINRPLTKPEHYVRFVGERVKIRLREKQDGASSLSGELVGLRDGVVTVRTTVGDQAVRLELIARARLHRDVDAILRAARERQVV